MPTVPAAADRLAAEIGCNAYHDLDAMLADPDVDVVTICTPSGAHMEPAVAAAKAGKHVIVEKPLEVTLKRCDKIIQACEKAGVTLSAIFPSRFHESSRLLKRAVDRGRFGRLTMGDAYLKVRNVPLLSFHQDTSAEYGSHMDKLFKKIEAERQSDAEESDEENADRDY